MEELNCLHLEYSFYKDLMNGVTFSSRVTGKHEIVKTTIPSQKGVAEEFGWFSKGQMLDYLLSIPTYAEKLTPQFAKASINWWGGLKNRWSTTKGLYIGALVKTRQDGVVILQILETANGQPDWDEMVRAAGGLSAVRDAIKYLPYGKEYFQRMNTLQAKGK